MASTYKAQPSFASLTEVGPNIMTASFDLANTASAAGVVVNDIIQFIALPPGALLTALWFDFPIMWATGSGLIDVGTDLTAAQGGVDVAGFFSSAAVGTNFTAIPAVISEFNCSLTNVTNGDVSYVHGSLPFNYKQESQYTGILLKNANIQIKIHTAGTTPATTGVISCTAEWTMTQLSNMQ